MERQRSRVIQALEIYDHSVKCQKCGNAVSIVGKLARTNNDRIGTLQKRIKWMENYSRGVNDGDLKALKQELAALLEEVKAYHNEDWMDTA